MHSCNVGKWAQVREDEGKEGKDPDAKSTHYQRNVPTSTQTNGLRQFEKSLIHLRVATGDQKSVCIKHMYSHFRIPSRPSLASLQSPQPSAHCEFSVSAVCS